MDGINLLNYDVGYKSLAEETDDPNKLIELSKHKNVRIRQAVAFNKHTPVDVLMNLSTDEDHTVITMVAHNGSSTKEVLLNLIRRSSYTTTILAAVNNKNTDIDVLDKAFYYMETRTPDTIYDFLSSIIRICKKLDDYEFKTLVISKINTSLRNILPIIIQNPRSLIRIGDSIHKFGLMLEKDTADKLEEHLCEAALTSDVSVLTKIANMRNLSEKVKEMLNISLTMAS